jgi:hypothetical protein
MVYWSTVLRSFNNDSYYSIHYRTHVWYTLAYLILTVTVDNDGYCILTVDKDGYYILTVDKDGYYSRHHRTYLW